MHRKTGFNPKRTIAPIGSFPDEQLIDMARRMGYGGNPEHKKNPNDYGLIPQTHARPGKTLCDAQGSFPRNRAIALLKAGFGKGLFSPCQKGEWPKNIWAISDTGEFYEAQLENREKGEYHGYPMPGNDTFRDTVKKEWDRR